MAKTRLTLSHFTRWARRKRIAFFRGKRHTPFLASFFWLSRDCPAFRGMEGSHSEKCFLIKAGPPEGQGGKKKICPILGSFCLDEVSLHLLFPSSEGPRAWGREGSNGNKDSMSRMLPGGQALLQTSSLRHPHTLTTSPWARRCCSVLSLEKGSG